MKPKKRIEAIAQDESEKLAEVMDDVKVKISDMQDNIVTYVKENPLKSVGLSIIAGMIAAQIFRSRK